MNKLNDESKKLQLGNELMVTNPFLPRNQQQHDRRSLRFQAYQYLKCQREHL